MTRIVCALIVALAAWMLPATAAQAATYCVGAPPGCSGTASTLSAAITAARASGEDDVIRLGSGTHDADQLQVTPNNPGDGLLQIVGQGATGAGATVLTRDAVDPAPVVEDASTSLADLQVVLPDSGLQRGLDLFAGSGERLSIGNAGNSSGNQTGLRLAGNATLSDSTVSIAGPGSSAVNTLGTSGTTVTDSTLSSDCFTYYSSTSSSDTLQRSTVTGGFPVTSNGGNLTVDSTVIRLSSAVCAIGGALTLQGDGSTTRALTVRNVTVSGLDQPGSRGLRLHRQAGSAQMTALVRNSVFAGVQDALERTADAALAPPTAKISASAFEEATAAGDYDPGLEPNFDDPAPGFLDAAAGDFRLAHDSFLVDRGESADPGGSATDRAGLARVVDGSSAVNGSTARRDIGAFEYQRLTPTVTASVTPTSARTGRALTFSASGDARDPGEAIASYAWEFDDGTAATGASVSKAFSVAGAHSATVTATDESGLTVSRNVAFTVTAPPAAPAVPAAPAQPQGSTTPPAVMPPVVPPRIVPPATPAFRVAFVRRTSTVDRRGRAPVGLRCPATAPRRCAGRLTLTVQRRVRGRRRSVVVGRATFSIAPGRTATPRVRLSRSIRSLMRRSRRFTVRAEATVTGGQAAGATLTVRPRRR